MKKNHHVNVKLLPKFVVSLTILGVVLSIVISLFSYVNTRSYLESMYAQRVVFGAQSIATMLPVEDVKKIMEPGGNVEYNEKRWRHYVSFTDGSR